MYFYHDCRWYLAFRRDWEGTDSVFFPEESRRQFSSITHWWLLQTGAVFFMMNGHELHEFDGKWIGTCTALLRTQNYFYYKPHLTNCTSVFSMSKHFEHSHTLTQCRGRLPPIYFNTQTGGDGNQTTDPLYILSHRRFVFQFIKGKNQSSSFHLELNRSSWEIHQHACV